MVWKLKDFDLKRIEEIVRNYWEEININFFLESKEYKKELSFIEGPPTMNGEPHIGHIRGRIIKDLWFRFQNLRGHKVIFRAGWDTQGLPIELQAEKELGLTGSKVENLAKIGEEKMVEACKELVHKYNKKWIQCDKLFGISLNYDKAYWTYKDEYIEREWKYLEKAWKIGLLGEGYRVVAYCPSCQTSLSHAEVGQGYEKVTDPSVYFKMKLASEDAYLILWTTMPFTIVTDEIVGVKPDAEYVYLRVKDEIWIVAKNRVKDLMEEIKIEDYREIKRVLGKDLEGKRYLYPLLDYVKGQRDLEENNNVHIIVGEEFVDITTGTGLVHMSPANGEIDFLVAQRLGLPIFSPFDEQVRFTKEAGVFQGLFVRDADEEVIKLLDKEKYLVKASKIIHEYPLCWRSKHKLIWLARREYFYWVNKIKDLALEALHKVEYYYPAPKNRFLEIVKEGVPWCISRERVWGTPLPIWVCKNCKNKIGLFSREEILRKALKLPDGENFELHKPWIDRIIIKCDKCGGEAFREPFVLDTWHNSGAAPYASLTDEEFDRYVPAHFMTEGIDQTRGWAYTLLMLNIVITGKADAPYRAFLFQGHVLDEKGNKMSKSLGNIIEGLSLAEKNSVDLIRFYLMWKVSPIESLNFSIKEMMGRPFQVLNTLYNLHLYFVQNSTYDNFSELENNLDWAYKRKLITEKERWIISKMQKVIQHALKSYEEARYNETCRILENFIINDLSQGYLPMIRTEIWEDSAETRDRRLAIYAVLCYLIKALDILLHPISPFITEYLYQASFKDKKISILLDSMPEADEVKRDEKLEGVFEEIFEIVSLANSARNKAKIKRRWPLKEAIVFTKKMERLKETEVYLKELLNVKALTLTDNFDNFPAKVRVKLKEESLKMKKDLLEIRNELSKMDGSELFKELEKRKEKEFEVKGKKIKIGLEDLEFEVISVENYTAAGSPLRAVALNTLRDERLIEEGIIRDLARRLQVLRKERGFDPNTLLEAAYIVCDDELKEIIGRHQGELAYLVRVKKLILAEKVEDYYKEWKDIDLEGRSLKIFIQ
ncbi:MAG: isoleucine--tRNA ligase [Nitrososphaerales archaeon]